MNNRADLYIKATRAAHSIDHIYETIYDFAPQINALEKALAEHDRRLDRTDETVAELRRPAMTTGSSKA